MEWRGYEGASFWISVALVIVTGMFVGVVSWQIRLERIAFERQEEELVMKNRLETFNQIDKFNEKIKNAHELIGNLCDNMSINVSIDTSILNDPERKSKLEEIVGLMYNIEIFALKQKELGLNIKIVHKTVGNIIIGVYDHPYIQNYMKNHSVEGTYIILDELVDNLKIEESKYKTMP